MSRRKKALLSAITAFSLQFVLLVVNLILPRLIIINYGSNVNGLINSITQFLAYIALLETGIGGVVSSMFYKALVKDDYTDLSIIMVSTQNFFRKISLVLVFYIVLLCFFYPLFVNNDFDFLYTISLLIIIGISSFIQYYFGLTNQLLIKADQRGYIVNISKIITYIISTLVMCILIKIGFSIQFVKFVGTLILSISPLSYFLYVRKKYKIDYDIEVDKNILAQRWDGFAHQMSAFIHSNTDIVILTLFSAMSEVSVYSVYLLIVTGLRSFITIFSNSLSSTFGNLYANHETKKLEKHFQIFDYFNILVVFFVFSIAAVTITPFVKIYTAGVTDANYSRLLFGIIMVIGEAVYCLRCSYSNIIFIAGNFRQTKWHAYIESIINVVVSILLLKPFGIVGIAIGTLCGMIVRWILSIYYVNKEIINLDVSSLVFKYIVNFICVLIFVFVFCFIPLTDWHNYLSWIVNCIILSFFLIVILFIINFAFCKGSVKEIIDEYFGNIINKKG